MPLSAWSARLAEIQPSRAPLDSLGLHVADAIAALHAGSNTREGRALARVHARKPGQLASGGRLDAAGVSLTAATIRLTEIDDIHLETCITASSVIVPAALAATIGRKGTPDDLVRALVAGYATLLQQGRAVGGAAVLAQGIWPTLVTAPMGAAAAAAGALNLGADRIAAALRLALLKSVARVGQPAPPLSGRWYVLGEAVADGVKAALAAAEGLSADAGLDEQLLPKGAVELFKQAPRQNEIEQISFKPFCTARQAAAGVFAFRDAVAQHQLDVKQIAAVEVEVPRDHIGMLSRPLDPAVRLSTLTSQGFQIALAATAPDRLFDVERAGPLPQPAIDFAKKVQVKPTGDFDALYPRQWPARVTIILEDGRRLTETRNSVSGDPDAPLDLAAIHAKAVSMPKSLLEDAAASVKNAAALERMAAALAQ
jgi:2-methylcitrate dehydratase PrpD